MASGIVKMNLFSKVTAYSFFVLTVVAGLCLMILLIGYLVRGIIAVWSFVGG